LISITGEAFNSEEVVIPETVRGYEVNYIKNNRFSSPNIEKFFISGKNYGFESESVFSTSKGKFSKLEKLIFLSSNYKKYRKGFSIPGEKRNKNGPYTSPMAMIYVTSNSFDDFYNEYIISYESLKVANISYLYNYNEEPHYDCYWEHGDDREVLFDMLSENPIKEGYELDGWYTDKEGENEFDLLDKANNREDLQVYAKWQTPNDGYYWIDDIEEGEKIKTIPINPERDDYEFTGWYEEEECINKINLEEIIMGEETITLYAGWEK